MNFDDYQKAAFKTAIMSDKIDEIPDPLRGKALTLSYLGLGITGEAGEIADHIKKILRDDGGKLTFERVQKLKKEIGDEIWYLASLCTELGLSFSDIALDNVMKLADRAERGVICGDGDER